MSEMGRLLPISVLVTFYLCCVAGQTPCSAPDGKRGLCRSIFDCKNLVDTASMATSNKTVTLSNSFCRMDKSTNVVEVCCLISDSCVTPDGAHGTCVELQTCPHLTEKLKSTPTLAAIKYAHNHICQGDEDRVCCTTESYNFTSIDTRVYDTTCRLHTLPPEYASGCCGYHNTPQIRIFGGSMTKIDEYPWLALLEYEKRDVIYLQCGGALISGKHVLTAAHCFSKRLPARNPTKVRLGEFNKATSGRDCVQADGGGEDCTDGAIIVRIADTIVHPEYNKLSNSLEHDIALIKLEERVNYTDFIRPICLPTYDFTLSQENVDLYVAGWGMTENGSSSDTKMKVRLPFVPMKICRSINGPDIYRQLGDGQMCAGGEPGKDSCGGDSGGPLMRISNERHELVGIVSFGLTSCGTSDVPGVYTKVFHYLPWIKHNIGELTFKGYIV